MLDTLPTRADGAAPFAEAAPATGPDVAAVHTGATAGAGTDPAAGATPPADAVPAVPVSSASLGLMIGGQRLLLELTDAGEISPLTGSLMAIPLTRPWVLGLVNLRGTLFTVSDLSRFAGGPPVDLGKSARLIALSPNLEFAAAIVADRMLGLRNRSAMTELEPQGADSGTPAAGAPPRGLADPAAEFEWLGRTYVDAEGHRWRELLLPMLVRNEQFLLIGR